jgi:hypothetical protein
MASRLGALALAAACAVASPAASAAELEGVQLQDRVKSGKADLHLNGLGLRTRFIFNVYVAGLYLPEKTQSGEAAISMRGPKRVTLVMLRDVGADTFGEALLAGLRNNLPPEELAPLKPQVDDLMGRIAAIGEARKGDVIELDYTANPGTVMRVNGVAQGGPIAGEAFFRALLRTWVGERPAQEDLKKALLGQQG